MRPICTGMWVLGEATSVLQMEGQSTVAEVYSDKRQAGLNRMRKEICCSQKEALQCVASIYSGLYCL